MKKYRLTDETMEFEGRVLRRIYYIRNIKNIKKGSIGGWIESESNLSHEGDCRVMHEAKVFDNARVEKDAVVSGEAIIKDNAIIKSSAHVFSKAIVGADTVVSGKAWIFGSSKIYFFSIISDNKENNLPNIFGNSQIFSTEIQATGGIYDSTIHDSRLEGHLNFDNEDITD